MPRKPVSEEIKATLLRLHEELREDGRDPSATQVLQKYERVVGSSFRKKGIGVSKRTIQRVLKDARPQIAKARENPQEQPWSTATLDKYPIPPEALPAVLRVCRACFAQGGSLTIREAKWVSRLSALQQDIEELSFIARRHAEIERLCELTDQSFPLLLDMLLVGWPAAVELASDKHSFFGYLARSDRLRGDRDSLPTAIGRWQEIKAEGGSKALQALNRVWYQGGTLTSDEEALLRQLHDRYPFGQPDFRIWLELTLRQVFEKQLALEGQAKTSKEEDNEGQHPPQE